MSCTASQIRSEFIDYFIKKQHSCVDSSGLVPDNDPTLMFVNSGMVQFKDVFIGKKVLPFKKATTSQKCLRAGGKHNDLENVGYTARHHTFFEMLGNFSFGDYFKEEAIKYAWDFVTKNLNLSKDRLLVTVHSSDNEAQNIWKKISGFDDSKIIKIPTNDNFWSMGDTGPCGPCSEIFYDHGDKIPGGIPGSIDQDGDRFVEIWNLVFMQYETLKNKERIDLPSPSIDTGMGLERISAVLQGVHNNYEIDIFKSIINDIKNITNLDDIKYSSHNNVIADHIRAICFMIVDGIIPTNEARGYVLRRIIRRALRHGYMMGLKDPFLYKLINSVEKTMGDQYRELSTSQDTIKQIVKGEEENFMNTIDKGMFILQNEINKLGSKNEFPADIAYKLYDTFGFPFDLTQDILRNENKKIDEKEFQKISNSQKELSKKGWSGTGDSFTDKIWYDLSSKIKNIEFLRDKTSTKSQILAIVKESKIVNETTQNDENVFIITKETPFYAESGGQIGDNGFIKSSDNNNINIALVIDTQIISGIIVHKCIIKSGSFKIDQKVNLEINKQKRLDASKNHTATHILQRSLKEILGNHIAQKGSLVNGNRLRFDFIHNAQINSDQIAKLEEIVLNTIDDSMDISTEIMDIEKTKNTGAIALFGEKYQEKVRVVTIGNGFSKELCGGTHVLNTSQIGSFKIISFSSIGSGIKRIEAITGRSIRKYLESEIDQNKQKIESQFQIIKNLEKQIEDLSSSKLFNNINIELDSIESIKIGKLLINDAEQKVIFNIIDKEKTYDDERCLIIGNQSSKNKKISVIIFMSQKILSKFNAKNAMEFIKNDLKLDVKFGGKPEMIQSSGIDNLNFDKFVDSLKKYIVLEK